MGDKRFLRLLRRVERAADRAAEIRTLSDAEVVSALAATSEARNPYIANVLATEAHNRLAQRRRLEAQLRESEARFRLAVRAASDAVWDVDLRRGTVWRSHGFHESFGYSHEALERATEWWSTRIHPDDRGRVEAAWKRWLESDEDAWEAEFRILRGDGEYAHVRDRGYRVRDAAGRSVRAVGAMVDVTKLHHAESALEEQEAHHRAIVEAADRLGIGVAITMEAAPGGERAIQYINAAGERILGRAARSLSGAPAAAMVAPEDRPALERHVRRVLQGGAAPARLLVRTIRPDGAVVPVEAGLSHTTHGGRDAVVCFFRACPERAPQTP